VATGLPAHNILNAGDNVLADFFESFDNGVGALAHTWGDIDTSVRGQVTMRGDSSALEFPNGASSGHGYGTYTIVAQLSGDQAGPAGLLWPADDRWPGNEMDLIEVIGGTPYGAMHFRASDGGDGYGGVYYSGLDETQTHTYTLDWQPGHVEFSVDGRSYGGFSDNVTPDAAHGGVNVVMGIMNKNPSTSMTVYEVSYTASGGGGGSSAVQAAPVVQASAQPEDTGGVTTGTTTAAAETVVSTESTASTNGQPAWWPAWEAAWNANHNSSDTSWQGTFWAQVNDGVWG
jgi:Glycosyl hydrolases family 16